MNWNRPHRRRESGQAAVETALTMPLLIFLVLGTTQLFGLLQARILAQVAAYRAVRAGSLNQGDCLPMMHSAILTLLPTITDIKRPTDTPADTLKRLSKEFGKRADNRLDVYNFQGPMVEIVRERPLSGQINGADDSNFDDPDAGPPSTLEIRMVYWYYMKIPFANRIMSWMYMAHFGVQKFQGQNPLMYTDARKANWTQADKLSSEYWPGGSLAKRMRTWSNARHYLFPIEVNAAMRMMTPARKSNFLKGRACPLVPK